MFHVRKELREEDDDATSMFSLLVADYKPQYWYWEPVELVRKLLLSGILSLVGRGSIAQAALGTVISFAFFALHLKVEPYNTTTLNFVKAVSEVQLFLVLQTSVVLQRHNAGFDSETLQPEAYMYGDIQTVATLLIAPVLVFLIGYNVKGLVANDDDNAHRRTLAFENEGRTWTSTRWHLKTNRATAVVEVEMPEAGVEPNARTRRALSRPRGAW
jgi:hypothetical protein